MGRLGVSRRREQKKWGSSRRRDERGDNGVRHRASPGRIMKLYAHLTAGQRQMIEAAGFGALLRIQCPTLPSRICTWLIRRFDPESCELVIPGRGRIPVTVDGVHRVLGIPNSGRDVVYRMDEKSIEFVLDKHGVTKPPSVASLEKSLKLMKSADDQFLRTFMMLVLSTFLCPNSSLKVSPRCFPSLVDVGSIKDLNWCRFVVEQLENCISSYGKKNTVGGCLFCLLIIYLDSLDIQGLVIPDGTPRISAWDQKLLNKVIMMDRKSKASFGKCFLKREEEATRKIKSSSATSVLLGDVSAIANFVSANVRPEYTQQNKEVLCKATGNLCASITDALAKFMREVSGLEGCSREAGKHSNEVAVIEDNNAENDGDQMDVDALPDDSSELASKDMEDTSVDEYEDESSKAGDSSSADSSEDDPDWEDFSNSITRFHSRQNRLTRNSDSSKEPGDGDVTTNSSGNVTTNVSGNDSDIPEGNLGGVNRCSVEQGNVVKLAPPSVHEDVALPSSAVSQGRGKAVDVTTNGSGNDLGILEGDQGRVSRCSDEHVSAAKLIPTSGHEDVVVSTSTVSQAKSTKQKNTKKGYFLKDSTVIQPASLLYGESSMLALSDDGNPSKEDKSMEKTPVVDTLEGTPVIDLSTPTSSDSECNGSKRSS